MRVEFIYALPRKIFQHSCDVAVGSVLQDVLASLQCIGEWKIKQPMECAVYGQRVTMDYILQDGDRVEILRPLILSPMEARRLRAEKARKKES